MKHILLSLFVLSLSYKTIGQTQLTISDVVHIDSTLSQDELYSRARLWFVEMYNSSKDVLQVSDKETGELIGKSFIPYYSKYFVGSATTKGNIQYTVKIWVKNGRYKYEFTDFIHEANPLNEHPLSAGVITTDSTKHIGLLGKRLNTKVWKEMQDICIEHTTLLIKTLNMYMLKQSKGDTNNW